MSRFDYRGGIAPIKTKEELAQVLPIVILFLVDGSAIATFPNTDRSNPSPFVTVSIARRGELPPPVGFPLFFHWTQWEELVVPLLQKAQTWSWRGNLPETGTLLRLLNNVYGAGGVIKFPVGFPFGSTASTQESIGRLYGCDPSDLDRVGGKTLEYMKQIHEIVLER